MSDGAAQDTATFFRSRWVERPDHVRELEPTVLPEGFRAAGVAAGIKPGGRDVGVLVSDEPGTVSAARFCATALPGAPVVVSRQARLEALRGVVASSGNANVADGERGLGTAIAGQRTAAKRLGLEPHEVAIAATGVIGRELPRGALLAGIETAVGELERDSAAFCEAILTTDRGPKRACLEVELPCGTVRLAAQAKGAGMLSPRFATMFCFVECDADLEPQTVELLTGVCVKRSFERITVDGQLSTSDTVVAMANGCSGVRVGPESEGELKLGEALDALLRQLALEMVADGEGAARVGRVVVRGATEAVEPVARAVADSPLVKTALHGADPNFGRILQAVAAVWPEEVPFVIDLDIEGTTVVSGGAVVDLGEDGLRQLEAAVGAPEVEYELRIPGEGGETEVFFSDLSCGYVELNAEYTS